MVSFRPLVTGALLSCQGVVTPQVHMMREAFRIRRSRPGPRRWLTVREVGALSDLDNITVRIADIAANLAVLGYRLRDELGSSTFPQFVARLDIRNAGNS